MTDEPVPMDLDFVKRFLRNREEDVERLKKIETSTNRLAEEVNGLTGALNLYATKTQVKEINEILDEHDAKFEERARELIRIRLRIRRRTNVMFGLTIALILFMTAVFAYYSVREQTVRRALCEQRNHDSVVQARETRDFFAPKLAEEKRNAHPDPVLVTILQSLANSQPQTLNCH